VSRRRSARKAAKTLYRFFVFHKIFKYLRGNAASGRVVSGWRWARVAVVALYRFFVFHKNLAWW
jgi:hypothetical protein